MTKHHRCRRCFVDFFYTQEKNMKNKLILAMALPLLAYTCDAMQMKGEPTTPTKQRSVLGRQPVTGKDLTRTPETSDEKGDDTNEDSSGHLDDFGRTPPCFSQEISEEQPWYGEWNMMDTPPYFSPEISEEQPGYGEWNMMDTPPLSRNLGAFTVVQERLDPTRTPRIVFEGNLSEDEALSFMQEYQFAQPVLDTP
jgi:hypothetical protein